MGQTASWLETEPVPPPPVSASHTAKAPRPDDALWSWDATAKLVHKYKFANLAIFQVLPDPKAVANCRVHLSSSCNQRLVDALYNSKGPHNVIAIRAELMSGNKSGHYAWWAFPTSTSDHKSAQGPQYQFKLDADAMEFVSSPLCKFAILNIFSTVFHRTLRCDTNAEYATVRQLLGGDDVKLHASCTYIAFIAATLGTPMELPLLTMCCLLIESAFDGKWAALTLKKSCRLTADQMNSLVQKALGIRVQAGLGVRGQLRALFDALARGQGDAYIDDGGYNIFRYLTAYAGDLRRAILGTTRDKLVHA